MRSRLSTQHGFSYFGVLFTVTLVSLALVGTALVSSVQQQRQKERALLFIGQQYLDAIGSYYHASPGGFKQYPRSLDDLLRDTRYPGIKRHLRQPWPDPMLLAGHWQLIRNRQGGIVGIQSLSTATPLKQGGFSRQLLAQRLSGKKRYMDWRFVYDDSLDDRQREEYQVPETPEDEDGDTENVLGDSLTSASTSPNAEAGQDEDSEQLLAAEIVDVRRLYATDRP
ncbi:type II secretion system protein [Methylobacillus flagellatus]|uniref:type II secretion system protein n=1 Tax=Methylobacillus flagellatus TaxID=405 RepID=UPI0010FA185E|nr:type II secretion system protein [Methylobacillus flagellatus]